MTNSGVDWNFDKETERESPGKGGNADGWITSCGVTSESSLHFWATCHFFCITRCKSLRKSLGGVTVHPGEFNLPIAGTPVAAAAAATTAGCTAECCFIDDLSGSRLGSVGGSADLHTGSMCDAAADAAADAANAAAHGLWTSRSSNVIRRFFLLGLLFSVAPPHSGAVTLLALLPMLPVLALLPARLKG